MRGVALCEKLMNWLPAWLRPALGRPCRRIVRPGVAANPFVRHGAIHLAAVFERPLREVALLFLLRHWRRCCRWNRLSRRALFLLAAAWRARRAAVRDALSSLWPALALDAHIYAIIAWGAVGLGHRRPADHDLHCPRDDRRPLADHRGVDRRHRLGTGHARDLRLFLRDLALPSARREHSQRRRRRLDSRADGAADDACGCADGRSPHHVARFRIVFPLGSATQVVAVDEDKNYAGIVQVAEAHTAELDQSLPIRNILHHRDTALLPTMTVRSDRDVRQCGGGGGSPSSPHSKAAA